MDDYIKRKDAIEEVRKSFDQSKTGKSTVVSMLIDAAFLQARSILQNIPAADVREDKKGMWLHDKDDEIISGYCNCCGWAAIVMETDVADMPFCPNCGADMRGEKDE